MTPMSTFYEIINLVRILTTGGSIFLPFINDLTCGFSQCLLSVGPLYILFSKHITAQIQPMSQIIQQDVFFTEKRVLCPDKSLPTTPIILIGDPIFKCNSF